jgi:hypothetical protein
MTRLFLGQRSPTMMAISSQHPTTKRQGGEDLLMAIHRIPTEEPSPTPQAAGMASNHRTLASRPTPPLDNTMHLPKPWARQHHTSYLLYGEDLWMATHRISIDNALPTLSIAGMAPIHRKLATRPTTPVDDMMHLFKPTKSKQHHTSCPLPHLVGQPDSHRRCHKAKGEQPETPHRGENSGCHQQRKPAHHPPHRRRQGMEQAPLHCNIATGTSSMLSSSRCRQQHNLQPEWMHL